MNFIEDRNPHGFKEEPIGEEMLAEIRAAIAEATQLLNLSGNEDTEAIVSSVKNYVGNVSESGIKIEQGDAIKLGCIWGEQICKELNWHWARIIENGETAFEAIVSPEARFVIFPLHFIDRIVKGLEKDRYFDNTILLTFNMLKAGDQFDAKPGDYRIQW